MERAVLSVRHFKETPEERLKDAPLEALLLLLKLVRLEVYGAENLECF